MKGRYLDQVTTLVIMFATVYVPTTPEMVYQKYLAYSLLDNIPMLWRSAPTQAREKVE
jgi:hypothetical protein